MIRNEETQYNYDFEWEMSRKTFLRSLLLGSIALYLPVVGCDEKEDEIVFTNIKPLSQNQFKTLRAVLETLFPASKNTPGSLNVNADRYFLWLINDKRTNPRENDFLTKKLSVLNDESMDTATSGRCLHKDWQRRHAAWREQSLFGREGSSPHPKPECVQ